MAAEPRQMMSDWFRKAADATSVALKTTAKFQEDTMHWWAQMMGGSDGIQAWQKRAEAMVSEAIPAAQKSAQEYAQAVEQIYKRGLDLLRKSFESGEFRSIEDFQPRVMSLWEEMLGTLRANTQSFVKANMAAMESWAELVRKGAESKRAQ